jgi:hypothetical protein
MDNRDTYEPAGAFITDRDVLMPWLSDEWIFKASVSGKATRVNPERLYLM